MPRRIGLDLARWPQADHAAWASATADGDRFEGSGTAAHWRPKSRYQAQAAYGRWLAFVQWEDPDMLEKPAEQRLSCSLIRAYVEHLTSRIASVSVAAEIGHLKLAASAMFPEQDWSCLRGIHNALVRRAVARDKRSKIVHARRLFELGMRLMDTADRLAGLGGLQAYRDGLIIALLAARPLRLANLSAIRIGNQLEFLPGGALLRFEAAETKNRKPLEIGVPDRLLPYLTRFLKAVRPRFPGAGRHDGLWPSAKGGPLCPAAIYGLIVRRTRTAFGVGIHPHLFRDIAATTMARESPRQVLAARDLLGHARLETTTRHYMQAQTVEAGRRYANVVSSLRDRARRGRSC